MTYYEWVSYIEDLTNKVISDDDINKINTYNFEYSQNIMIRLTDHIISVFFKKLNTQGDNLYNELDNINSPQELSILINKIKDTIDNVKKLLTIKYFEKELIDDLREELKKYAKDYTDTIKKSFTIKDNSEYTLIINNMNLMEEK